MQPTTLLGIYLAKDHATIVCLDIQGEVRNLVACFGVSIEQTEQSGIQALAGAIAAAVTEKQLKFTETVIALDCAMFMQHNVHSEFSDAKKIAQTVHFDTEEALGTDASDVAIAFKIDFIDEHGSNLSVFTAQKKLLSELISALQANNLDPVCVEPDITCLARFLCQSVSLPGDAHPLYATLSRRNGYLVTPLALPWQGVSPTPSAAMRTFLLSSAQDRTDLLTKQVSITTALLQNAGAINRIEVLDTADSINYVKLAEKLTIQAERIDITRSPGLSVEKLADCPDPVAFAIAYGAAIVYLDSASSVNWRSDFMPYEGRKMRLQNTLKFFSAAAVILMFALGLYGMMQAVAVNKYRARLGEKFAKEFSEVMPGEKMPAKSKEAVRRIGTALRRVKDAQKGFSLTGEEAIAGKLTYVLQAFNKCAASISLHVENVSITDKSITISGDTSSRENTLKVFEAMRQTGLNVLQQNLNSQGGRDTFNVTVEPKK